MCIKNWSHNEVLGTRWLPYEDILKLKMVESMVELYYNSGQFQNTIACVEPLFEDAFTLYEKLGQFYEKKGYSEISHSECADMRFCWSL